MRKMLLVLWASALMAVIMMANAVPAWAWLPTSQWPGEHKYQFPSEEPFSCCGGGGEGEPAVVAD